MVFEKRIIEHFNAVLIKRIVAYEVEKVLSEENSLILSTIGLPNKILDFQFNLDIAFLPDSKIVIGKLYNDYNIVINLKTGNIIRNEDNCFLAKSLKNFFLQLYTYDYLWGVLVKEARLGNYRENHQKYASFFESELLKIDFELLENDNKYFWGSLIEDIEFGIVG